MADRKKRHVSPVRLRIYNDLKRRGQPCVVDFEELVAYVEVSRPTISLHLDGHRRNPDVQDKIAEFYGLDAAWLFGTWYGRRAAMARMA